MTKARGKRAALDEIYILLNQLRANAKYGAQNVIYAPKTGLSALDAIDEQAEAVIALIRDNLEPYLERAERPQSAPQLADLAAAVADLQRRLERLEQQAPPRLVTRKAE